MASGPIADYHKILFISITTVDAMGLEIRIDQQ